MSHRGYGKKYQTIQVHPMSTKSASTLSASEEFDIDNLLAEIDSDVDTIMHSTYMDRLNQNEDRKERKERKGGRRNVVPKLGLNSARGGKHLTQSARAAKKALQKQGQEYTGHDSSHEELQSIQEIDQEEDYTARTQMTEISADENDDEDIASDSSGDDDVMLSHTQDATGLNPQKALEELRSMLKEVNVRLSESNEVSKEVFRLQATIHDLEDENHDLHEAMEEAVKHVQDVNASTITNTIKVQAVNTMNRGGKSKDDTKKKGKRIRSNIGWRR